MKLKIKVIVEFDTDFDDDVSNEDTAIFTLQQDLDDIGYRNVKITKIGFNISDDFIKQIQKEMLDYYLFDLTYEQVKNYVEKNMLNTFDTYERECYASYLAKNICDMDFPMNGDSEKNKKLFYEKLKRNAPKKGIIWLGHNNFPDKYFDWNTDEEFTKSEINEHPQWYKYEYDNNGNTIYYENYNGAWEKWEYDNNGKKIYYKNSDGVVINNTI